MTKPSDHGDRFGGLLIGYIGLITVPVALERKRQKKVKKVQEMKLWCEKPPGKCHKSDNSTAIDRKHFLFCTTVDCILYGASSVDI